MLRTTPHQLIRICTRASCLVALLGTACDGGSEAPPEEPLEAVIIQDAGPITLVNILRPNDGEDQQAVADLMEAGLQTSVRFVPGFIASAVHVSTDSDDVLVYSQWADAAAVQAVSELIMTNGAPEITEAFALAPPDPHAYDVQRVVLPPDR